jgi:hypothetical protein
MLARRIMSARQLLPIDLQEYLHTLLIGVS